MFEIQSGGAISPRQRNASNKARTELPSFIQNSPDSFRVLGGDNYLVRFFRSDDKVFASCECEAGNMGFPCYHAMRVYNDFYAGTLLATGKSLLNKKAVGSFGFVGNKAPVTPKDTLYLSVGQTFEAAIPVILTIEKQ